MLSSKKHIISIVRIPWSLSYSISVKLIVNANNANNANRRYWHYWHYWH